jgi:hypothetical protein
VESIFTSIRKLLTNDKTMSIHYFNWKKNNQFNQQKRQLLFLFLVCLFTTLFSFGQGGPCLSDEPADSLKIDILEMNFQTNVPFDINVYAIGSTMCVDTNYTGTVTLTKHMGPGNLQGPGTMNFNMGMAAFNGVSFDEDGDYILVASDGSIVNDTTFMIHVTADGSGGQPCLSDEPAQFLKFDMPPGMVQNNVPFNLNIFAVGASNCLDTNYSQSVTISKIQGPGNLNGTLTVNFNQGFASFNGLTLDQDGSYQILAESGLLQNDTIQNLNVNSGGGGGDPGGGGGGDPGGQPCPPTSTEGERTNMGLYGGSTIDLTFSHSTNRLFGAVPAPASVYYSDDNAQTWHRAFNDDSLEYGCGHGWGGRALRVLSNNVGWVGVQTSQEAGTLNAIVVSFDNGDTNTWRTAMDNLTMQDLGYNGMYQVSGMGLSDYYLYCLMNSHVFRVNDLGPIDPVQDVINLSSMFGNNVRARSIAVANSPSGYPVYMVLDTTSNFGMSTEGFIVKYDGSTFTNIGLPIGSTGATSIFTHPAQVTGDTLILNAMGITGSLAFRSYDGGSTWTDISSGAGGMVSDVDYSPNWVSSMPASNGAVIIIPGSALSDDLGDSWQTIGLTNNGGAVHPNDPSQVFGTMGRGVVMSSSGASGPYAITDNYGLEAVTIKKIARTENKSVFYLATKAGLAYTTAYLDTNVVGFDKWNAPYGEFPVAGVGDDAGVFSVAIDPNDSSHVIVGYSNGFSVTTTGVGGFANVIPTGWTNTTDPRANDIIFVNSQVAVAVTGGENVMQMGQGNIWRTADGGLSWSKVSPTGFTSGNAVAMGASSTDTVLYAGTGYYSGIQENGVLWKSIDLGLTWTQVNVGPTSSTNPGVTEMPIYDIAVDPRGTDSIYIASGSNLDHAFVFSPDGGLTYNTIDAHGEGAFTTVTFKGDNPDTVYMAIRRDILMYDALNDSVSYIFRGLPGELVPDLAFGSVLAGTSMGFFRVRDAILTSTPPTGGVESIETISFDELNAYPNPFSDQVTVKFTVVGAENVSINLYDLTGKLIANLTNNKFEEGTHEITFDSSSLKEGNYIIQLTNNTSVMTKSMVKVN